MAENCWCDNDLRKCGESYLLVVEVLERQRAPGVSCTGESYLLFVEVLEPPATRAHGCQGESYLLFVEVLEQPVIATLEPKKGFVYTGSNMYPKDQLY